DTVAPPARIHTLTALGGACTRSTIRRAPLSTVSRKSVALGPMTRARSTFLPAKRAPCPATLRIHAGAGVVGPITPWLQLSRSPTNEPSHASLESTFAT